MSFVFLYVAKESPQKPSLRLRRSEISPPSPRFFRFRTKHFFRCCFAFRCRAKLENLLSSRNSFAICFLLHLYTRLLIPLLLRDSTLARSYNEMAFRFVFATFSGSFASWKGSSEMGWPVSDATACLWLLANRSHDPKAEIRNHCQMAWRWPAAICVQHSSIPSLNGGYLWQIPTIWIWEQRACEWITRWLKIRFRGTLKTFIGSINPDETWYSRINSASKSTWIIIPARLCSCSSSVWTAEKETFSLHCQHFSSRIWCFCIIDSLESRSQLRKYTAAWASVKTNFIIARSANCAEQTRVLFLIFHFTPPLAMRVFSERTLWELFCHSRLKSFSAIRWKELLDEWEKICVFVLC